MADCADRATLDCLAEHPNVRVLETSVHDLGLARNIGIAEARGQFVTFLDGDDLWGPSWIRKAHEAATQRFPRDSVAPGRSTCTSVQEQIVLVPPSRWRDR